jgi:hypothetical protein
MESGIRNRELGIWLHYFHLHQKAVLLLVMKVTILRYILLIFLVLDISYSFMQHLNTPLEGDLPNIVLGYSEVMSDPFGLNVLLYDKVYGAPNRFFVHYSMSQYFKSFPLLLQNFSDPIDSVYLSCALIKTLTQVCIIFLLTFFISTNGKFLSTEFLLAAVLITPLFQSSGYNTYMGIINKSITYTFFYALPICILLFYFLILRIAFINKSRSKILYYLILLPLTVILPLSGAIIPAIILISFSILVIYLWQKQKLNSIKHPYIFFFFVSLICIFSLYSLYIGKNNSENLWNNLSILQRYLQIPEGIYYPLTQKLGLPLLVIVIIFNLFIITKLRAQNAISKISFIEFKWLGIFIAAYILLLPLGGYRIYRPNILRADTLIPVLICLMYIYGKSTWYILKQKQIRFYKLYVASIIILLFIFTWADRDTFNGNNCEREALEKISRSSEEIVLLENNCTVMDWNKITDYHQSEIKGKLLHYWNITNEEKRYYQK